MENRIEHKYILLIMNCKKYINKARYQKVTWLKNIPNDLLYYHVIGDEKLETNYIFDNENQILWVKTPDDYNSLPKKVIQSYKAVNERYDFKYIFKTDDDQILVQPQFFTIIRSIIEKKIPQIHYGGYIVDVKHNYLSQYYKKHPELPKHLPILKTKYCSGRFYFLSKEAINNLLLNESYISKEFLEDYAIGYYLHRFFKTNMINISTNQYFTDIENSDYYNWLSKN